MRIDREEALLRAREYFKKHGYPMASQQSVARITELIETAVRDTVQECAEIALKGVDPRAPTPKMLTKREVAMAIRSAFPVGAVPGASTSTPETGSQAPTGSQEPLRGDLEGYDAGH